MTLAVYLQSFVVRSIVPNTTGAYVLRVYSTWTEALSILAWRLEWWRNPQGLNEATPHESCFVVPVLLDDDFMSVGGSIDLIVDRGLWSKPAEQSWSSEAAAVFACQQELAGQ